MKCETKANNANPFDMADQCYQFLHPRQENLFLGFSFGFNYDNRTINGAISVFSSISQRTSISKNVCPAHNNSINMKFLICFVAMFLAVAQAHVVAPVATYAAAPALTYAAAPSVYSAAIPRAYTAYAAAPSVYSASAYVAAPSVYSSYAAPITTYAAAPALVSTLLKK